MKFLFDLFPIILFFITLKVAEKAAGASLILGKVLTSIGIVTTVKASLVPIMLATIAVIIGSIIQIIWAKLHYKKVDKSLWLSALLVIVLGGMTLYFQNDAFIKWKPTLLYWAFATVLIGANLFAKKNLIKDMMDKEISLPESIWNKLNFAWAIFFSALGALNIFVAFHYSIDTWANFKLFGTMGLMFIFIIGQSFAINKYIIHEDKL
jgi:intracellular septation protein